MFDKLEQLAQKYDELSLAIGDPDLIARQSEWQKMVKARADMEKAVTCYREYCSLSEELKGAKEILEEESDPEMKELAKAEVSDLSARLDDLEQQLKIELLPKDPNDDKNVILEFRAGTGGDEAALFASDLYKMYHRYAESKGWKWEIMSSNYTDIGGIKEVVCLVEGDKVYSRLKFESGVHRVQRVPDTESQGRIHTSAATVAVMPEAEEVEVEFGPNDVRIDVFCASGPGGQCVNTTQSAVRLTHIPTGIVVSCQDEKSQIKNKEKGMKVLRSRVYDKMLQDQQGDLASARKSMVGSGDRSERIRTYNFPQGRVTDHRINLTIHRLDDVLNGDLDEIINALANQEQIRLLEAEVD